MEQKVGNTTLVDSPPQKGDIPGGQKSFQLNTLALPFNLTQGQRDGSPWALPVGCLFWCI